MYDDLTELVIVSTHAESYNSRCMGSEVSNGEESRQQQSKRSESESSEVGGSSVMRAKSSKSSREGVEKQRGKIKVGFRG